MDLEERQRRVRKGEVAVRNVAGGDARGVLEDVARVPQNREARTLPYDDGRAGRAEERGGRRVEVVTQMSPFGCYDFVRFHKFAGILTHV